jgi:sugar O-acyltransferase (sialic acid O-acetyltransferase NeuD family)
MRIAIIGAGGHGHFVLDILRLCHPEGFAAVFFDDRADEISSVSGVPVLGPVSALDDDGSFDAAFAAIGDNRVRSEIQRRLEKRGHTFVRVIHPHSAISPQARLGDGSIAGGGVVVSCDAIVGRGVILSTLSSVGHNCHVGDYAQLTPGVNLGGACTIGEGVFLGMGTKVGPLVRVGEWSVVGAGAVVLEDLPDRRFCAGIPARPIRPIAPAELPRHPVAS